MNWQILSLVSCVLWGLCAILVSKVSKTQSVATTFLLFNVGTFSTALTFAIFNFKTIGISKESCTTTLFAGIISACAVMLQILSFSKWPERMAFIIIIGSLYPAMILCFSLIQGQKFSLREWLGFALALIAIVLVSLPKK